MVGRWFGVIIPSSDDFAGFLLAASSFLGLAYTFRAGGHIRVSLFTAHLRNG
ncbi:TRAP transporter small permease subunit [Vibrio sp. PP-XX7]